MSEPRYEPIVLTQNEEGIVRKIHLNICGCRDAKCRVRQGLTSAAKLVLADRLAAPSPGEPR